MELNQKKKKKKKSKQKRFGEKVEEDIIKKGVKYLIIYDDQGRKPVKKMGFVTSKENGLIQLESGEVLNTKYIIRMEEVQGL